MKDGFKIDFVGIGAAKCATTWIYECLKEHPEICMSRPKEANLFLKDYLNRGKTRESFAKCRTSQIKGEFSPAYLDQAKVVAPRLRAHNPNIKLIVSLKNPIQRAYSHYLHYTSIRKNDFGSFSEAVKNSSQFTEPGFYYKHLNTYFNFFSREQILVLVLEDTSQGSLQFIQKIYKFLGVDSNFVPKSVSLKVSPTKFKMTFLGKLLHKCLGQPLKKSSWGRRVKNVSFIRRPYLKFAEFYSEDVLKPLMSPETKHYLKSIYRSDIENLEKLINRDLNSWK